ncbi:MAG TPA: prepilin-type N-terminal cleavage/methylation domain-containing protein [Armatimonadota bacterium]|jgi:prepilin-type N-terminal cleavage/methylation domain-containing protein/prepilin-type processing-associated H-X9-DG protein
MQTRKGFTLIELLVVIAIIAILAAILFPVFARARAKAQQSNCLSNVKQITLGVLMYAADNDQWLPMYGGGYPLAWDCQIFPYIKNVQILQCPSALPGSAGKDPISTVADYGGYGDYNGTNPWGIPVYIGYGFQQHYRVGGANNTFNGTSIEFPAENGRVLEILQGNSAPAATGTGDLYVASRHNSGGNIGFMDGHSKWLAGQVFLSSLSNTALTTPADPNYKTARHFWYGTD